MPQATILVLPWSKIFELALLFPKTIPLFLSFPPIHDQIPSQRQLRPRMQLPGPPSIPSADGSSDVSPDANYDANNDAN